MSRSRKYHPYYKDRPSKGMKRIYNKRIRQALKERQLHLNPTPGLDVRCLPRGVMPSVQGKS